MVIKPLEEKKARKPTSLFQSVIIAACFSVAIASLWIIFYLFTYITPNVVILDIVLQTTSGTMPDFNFTLFLFIVITRFIVGFGVSWLPITLFVHWIRYLG